MSGQDLRPTSGKAEFHLTYACDLECMACNRASFLRTPHTEPMTLEDAEEFYRQADVLAWKPRIILIGGEPTLHRQFQQFLQRAIEWSGQDVQVFSNGYSPTAQRALRFDGIRGPVSIARESLKPSGSVMRNADFPAWTDDVFVSPSDFGKPLRAPCYQHASIICGVSVDHEGYAPCAMGGALEALLKVGGRTKRLADLFDCETMAHMTEALCRHCGHQAVVQGILDREDVDGCEQRFGTPMSPTWIRAFEGRR